MVFEFLTSDSFFFWTLLVIQSALIIWFVESANVIASGVTLTTVVATVLLFPEQWNGLTTDDVASTGVGTWLFNNAGGIVAGIACYFLAGLLWATFRWWLYVSDAREAYDEQKRQWLLPHSLLNSARLLEARASFIRDDTVRARYLHWATACRDAAAIGGGRLSTDLKPAWRDFVENGYQY